MRQQRKYDNEFKINAVKLYETSNKSLKQIADDLGIPSSTLDGWVKDYQKNGENTFSGSGNIKPHNEEYYRLAKELEDVKMERDILKKTIAIFSKPKK